MRPAARSEAWASESVAVPLNGLSSVLPFSEIQTATPAFLPGSAGPWKWAAVAGPERPEKLPVQLNSLVAGSKVAVTVPVPADWLGGTSVAPLMVAL